MDGELLETIEFACKSEADLPRLVNELVDFAGQLKVWIFVGDLGAGKTTIIKQICNYLGVNDAVSSPTFSIINEYLAANKPLYHFDFYRIKNMEEAIDIGVVEYFDSGNYCFIEWPQVVEQLLPAEILVINIDGEKEGKRKIKVTKYE